MPTTVEQLFARHERRYLLPRQEEATAASERRYLLPEPAALIALLDGRGKAAAYRVSTDYLAPDALNKNADRAVNHRLRYYGEDLVHGWLETKAHEGLFVTKARVQIEATPPGYHRIAGVTYARRAWEIGKIRVTLDEGVDDGAGFLPDWVLEVKGEQVPRWLRPLLPPRARNFSKRRWALARVVEQNEVA